MRNDNLTTKILLVAKKDKTDTGSVGYGTDLTHFCHSIHFIYRNAFPQNTKIDDGELNIPESVLYNFKNVGDFCYSLIGR